MRVDTIHLERLHDRDALRVCDCCFETEVAVGVVVGVVLKRSVRGIPKGAAQLCGECVLRCWSGLQPDSRPRGRQPHRMRRKPKRTGRAVQPQQGLDRIGRAKE